MDIREFIEARLAEDERSSLEDVAVRETEDERWDRAYVLSFDQTPDDDG